MNDWVSAVRVVMVNEEIANKTEEEAGEDEEGEEEEEEEEEEKEEEEDAEGGRGKRRMGDEELRTKVRRKGSRGAGRGSGGRGGREEGDGEPIQRWVSRPAPPLAVTLYKTGLSVQYHDIRTFDMTHERSIVTCVPQSVPNHMETTMFR